MISASFFILRFIGALQLWLAYQLDLSGSALSHQSASLIPFAHWLWGYISLRPRKHKAPSSSKGPGTPSTSLMSWICIPPRQLPYNVPRYQVLQAQVRNMTNITAQYSRKINGQRNGHRLSKPPITHFPGTHSPRRSPLPQVFRAPLIMIISSLTRSANRNLLVILRTIQRLHKGVGVVLEETWKKSGPRL